MDHCRYQARSAGRFDVNETSKRGISSINGTRCDIERREIATAEGPHGDEAEQACEEGGPIDVEGSRASAPSASTQPGTNATGSKGTKAARKSPKSGPSASDSPPSLLICRNKHWRYISCYHGTWLQMPMEILEAIAHINYNTPLPRPMDAGSLFDTVKVRRLVDEATNLAVRAASDMASPMLTNVSGSFASPSIITTAALGTPGHGARLSRERKFRMREQACQKLARAYRLDEISSSVATMQGASPLEDVGKLVMQRSPADADARYVHFFHEKIPSRQMAEWTDLQALSDVISQRPGEPEVLRTRALVRVFKRDLEGAILDLTHAMSLHRLVSLHQPAMDPGTAQRGPSQRSRRHVSDVLLTEKEQPGSFEGQCLFQRASICLTLASEHSRDGVPSAAPGSDEGKVSSGATDDAAQRVAQQAESRRLAKHFAKRAIRDYMAFLSHLHYSPDYPVSLIREYSDRVGNLANSGRLSRDASLQHLPHTVYALPELFAAVPPANLPSFPEQGHPEFSSGTCEWMTFHPLLTESLHSLLLAHLLVQTSAKELRRHAYMVARLVRLADGFPIFHASRCPSRADWLEILRRSGNWLQLTDTWENLTSPPSMMPVPLPGSVDATEDEQRAAASLLGLPSVDDRRKTRIRHEAILEALGDERVVDEAGFRLAVKARERRAERDLEMAQRRGDDQKLPGDGGHEDSVSRWLVEDSREYPILTDRAACLTRWLLEAPAVTGRRKRRKGGAEKALVRDMDELQV